VPRRSARCPTCGQLLENDNPEDDELAIGLGDYDADELGIDPEEKYDA
jgi:hypothetical protein